VNSIDIINNLHNDVSSSYADNGIGKVLYEYVIDKKPNIVIELGTLHGYSAICIGLALRDNGFGSLTCYDLWEDYEFTNTSMDNTKSVIDKFNLSDLVELKKQDAIEWCKNPEDFDLMHVDISNDGDKIEKIVELLTANINNGSHILFEGGTEERDKDSWIEKYGFKPITSVRDKIKYEIIVSEWPGLSLVTSESLK